MFVELVMLKCQLSEHNGHFQCLISFSHDFIDKSSQVGNTTDIWFSLSQSFALVYSTGLERDWLVNSLSVVLISSTLLSVSHVSYEIRV